MEKEKKCITKGKGKKYQKSRTCGVLGEHEKKNVVATRFACGNERNEATENEEVDGA